MVFALAGFYNRVVANDVSSEQICNAIPRPGIIYLLTGAENPGLADESVDLLTVSSAVHWFELESFYTEAQRVIRPNFSPGGRYIYEYQGCEYNCEKMEKPDYGNPPVGD